MGNFIVWFDGRRVASAGWDVSALEPGGFKKEDHELKKQGSCWLVALCYDELPRCQTEQPPIPKPYRSALKLSLQSLSDL